MTPDANKALIRDVLRAAERGDMAALAAHPGMYETVRYYPHMLAAFPDLSHTIEEQIAEGDTVATRVLARGTQRGEFMGVAPTGKAVAFIVLMMDRVVDGAIVLHHANVAWLDLLLPLGVIPSAGALAD